MAWKFLNIGKANAEIERLETELAASKAENDKLKSAEDGNAGEIEAHAEAVATENAGLKTQVATLTSSIAAKDSEIAALNTKVADTEKSVESRAAAKALQITAGQGQAPLPSTGATTTASGTANELEERIRATTNPFERTRIYRENKDKMKRIAEQRKR